MNKTQTYTVALARLEDTIHEIEHGDLTIDALTDKINEAAELVKLCRKQLRTTEEVLGKILDDIRE